MTKNYLSYKLKIKKCLAFAISLFLFAACSGANKSNQKEISLNDDYRKTRDGAIIIDDRDLDRNQQPIATTKESTQDAPQTGSDGSLIQAMTDGFGNRVETRIFEDHPLVRRIVLRTFVNGQKKGFVYGQNGDVNELPEEMSGNSMAAPADKLAKSAGILTGRDENNLPYFIQRLRQPLETLMPAYEFPMQTIVAEQIPAEVQTAETAPIAPIAEPVIEQKPLVQESKPTAERNYQADINKILLQSNNRRTGKTEGTLTQNAKSETAEKGNK